MNITCIGRYGPYPKAGASCSSYLLRHGEKNIVVDLGCGSLTRLLGLLNVADIDALILSHLHADHMGDALTLRYALDASHKMGLRQEPLPVYLPDAPKAEYELLATHGMMDTRVLSDGMTQTICGLEVSFGLMPHPVPSYAMAFCADGKKFVYSGDTRETDRLAPFAAGADLFIMEAAFLSRDKKPGAPHVNAREAGGIAAAAQAKRMLVTHLFPGYDPAEVLSEVRETYPDAELIEELCTYEV